MSATVMPALLTGLVAEGEAARSLPMPDVLYGVLAFAVFLLLLGITWMFRNAGHTLMVGPDTVEHGKHRASGHGTSEGGTGPGH